MGNILYKLYIDTLSLFGNKNFQLDLQISNLDLDEICNIIKDNNKGGIVLIDVNRNNFSKLIACLKHDDYLLIDNIIHTRIIYEGIDVVEMYDIMDITIFNNVDLPLAFKNKYIELYKSGEIIW